MGDHAAPPDRRTVLRAGAVLASGAAAVGCGGPTAPPIAPPTTADDPGGFGTGAPPAGGVVGGPGTVLGPAAAVPLGGGVVYPAFAVVVTRATTGGYRGFSAICPHDGCLVTEVAGGTILCPCHGSRFDLAGAVTRGPAQDPLAARPVRTDRGHVVLD